MPGPLAGASSGTLGRRPAAGGVALLLDAGYLRFLYLGNTTVTMAHLVARFLLGLVVVIATKNRLGRRPSDVLVLRTSRGA